MSNRTVIRSVITPRAITRRVGPAGAGGGATTFAALTDNATADLPAINTPLSTALAGKAALVHTHVVSGITPVASDRLIGRHAGGSGAAQEVTVGNGLEFSGSGIRRSALTGDVTAAAGSNSTSIAADAVSNGKLANMAQATIKGRASGAGTGDPQDLTATDARTALGLGSLATQNGTFSGTSSGTNTGDQDLSNYLQRLSVITVSGITTADFTSPLIEQATLVNGRRWWTDGSFASLQWDGTLWVLLQDDGSTLNYRAEKASTSYEPWLLTDWTLITESQQPTFTIDPVEPLGTGVNMALELPVNTDGGFLTAGTGGALPITRGGTGTTTASAARTALGLAPADTAATANTLVLRDGSGQSAFAGATFSGLLDAGDFGANGATGQVSFGSGSLIIFDGISYTYGSGSAQAHRTALGSGATGDPLFTADTPAAARGALGVRTFTKPSDESRVSNTAYTVDSHLKNIPLEAGKSYKIEFFLAAYIPFTEGGKARLVVPLANGTVPNGAGFHNSPQWGNSNASQIGQTTSGGVRFFQLAASGGYNQSRPNSGVAYTGVLSASGVLSLEWAQNVSGANATILHGGSIITVTEL